MGHLLTGNFALATHAVRLRAENAFIQAEVLDCVDKAADRNTPARYV